MNNSGKMLSYCSWKGIVLLAFFVWSDTALGASPKGNRENMSSRKSLSSGPGRETRVLISSSEAVRNFSCISFFFCISASFLAWFGPSRTFLNAAKEISSEKGCLIIHTQLLYKLIIYFLTKYILPQCEFINCFMHMGK